MTDLVERLRINSGWRNQQWQCVTDPALLTEAADRIEQLEAEIARKDALMEKVAQAERDAVVKWLRSDKIVLSMDGSAEDVVASAIEAGEHLAGRLNPGYVNQPIADSDTPGEYRITPPST